MELFLSYCHKDEKHLEAFRIHLATLKRNGFISDWHDREMTAGENIDETINEHLESADIIALLISPDFLASEYCQKELETAFALKTERDTNILSIIISNCDWKDVPVGEDSMLKNFLVCPTDAKAIENWPKSNDAWMDVVSHLKKVISERIIREKKLTKKFKDDMENPGDFVSTSRNNLLNLKDLYTYPMLKHETSSTSDKNEISELKDASFLIQENLLDKRSFLILGDDSSGKTALCYMLFHEFIKTPFFPIYIEGKNVSNDNINQIEKKAFESQYSYLRPDHILNKNKIIIFDDFANENIKEFDVYSLLLKIKEKNYGLVIMVGNTINPLFGTLQWDNAAMRNNIDTYNILPASYKTCKKIIHNWIKSTHSDEYIQGIEMLTDQYMSFMRTIYAENIMSLYAPQIIMILNARSGDHALFNSSDEPSSYGHCYSALITHALLKARVSAKDVGEYKNILMELAYYIYTENKTTITATDIAKFKELFNNKYMSLPDDFMENLLKSRLLTEDIFDICMEEYVLYYHVAQKLSNDFDNSDLRDGVQEKIEELLSSVHRKRNGHILLFLIHHMPRNNYLLDKINGELNILFKEYPEAELTTTQLLPLHKYISNLSEIKLEKTVSAEQREKFRGARDQRDELIDKSDNNISRHSENNDNGKDTALIEMGKSYRMMKIAGSLLKAEYKTMEKKSLVQLSKSTRGVAFRILSYYHIIMGENPEICKYFLEILILNKHPQWENLLPHEKQEILTAAIGGLVTSVAYDMISRCSWCIGSGNLTALISDNNSCPSYQLLDLSTSMWYSKKFNIKKIESLYKKFEKDNIMSTRLLQQIVVEHLHMHETNIKQRQQLAEHLNINYKSQNLIEYRRKRDN